MYVEMTSVPVERSRAEIEKLLMKHRCTQFTSGVDHEEHKAVVQFKAHNRIVRFVVALPNREDKQYRRRDRNGWTLSEAGITKKVEQAERQRWRALLLVIKAKLEAVTNNIATFEEEFLAHILLPNMQTVAEAVLPEIARIYEHGQMPHRLLSEKADTEPR